MKKRRRGPRGGRVIKEDPHKINGKILARQVRLVGGEEGDIGVVPTRDALSKAEDLGLDLVEISAKPIPQFVKS